MQGSGEPRFRQALRVWWAFTWRWPLLMLVPLVPIAALIALAKPSPDVLRGFLPLLTWALMIGAQIEAMRRVLINERERSHER